MSDKPKVLCFAGSLRKDSLNKKLARAACEAATKAGAEATYVDLKDYPMPIYDGDIEAESGIPENARKLRTLMKSHDAFLIASPEYNSTLSAALKNAVDWTSRPDGDEKSLACFNGKYAGLMAASPGALGGLRGLVTVRSMLSNISVIVVPEQIAIAKAQEAFDGDGKLTDAKNQQSLEKIAARVVDLVRAQMALKARV